MTSAAGRDLVAGPPRPRDWPITAMRFDCYTQPSPCSVCWSPPGFFSQGHKSRASRLELLYSSSSWQTTPYKSLLGLEEDMSWYHNLCCDSPWDYLMARPWLPSARPEEKQERMGWNLPFYLFFLANYHFFYAAFPVFISHFFLVLPMVRDIPMWYLLISADAS